ncbi:hypothetical protein M436DRAFT_41797 [Aureobasidium namibiae CBS 147.97]|uniref:Zn(2)-C6 fungal-type domain-containing protein n=1 Tax=Aureobasidium namibiae CBS 147.97 TaxID=1043004 RepID=A0A074WUK3_9PEZI
MQGVRTTRGCVNCRAKKKGCDMKKPTCGRCSRLRIQCTFEERKYVFVSQDGSRRPGNFLTSPSAVSLAKTDSSLVVDEFFWTNYLPQEDVSLDGSIGGILSAPWIPGIRKLADTDKDVKNALQACALTGFGWMNNDRTLVVRAVWFYAQALKQTNIALKDPVAALGDSVLACCRLLVLFEMLQRISPEPTAMDPKRNQIADWRMHVEGTCRLIQLRGRDRHLSSLGMDLYDGVRLPAVIQGLSKRQPNAFTQLDWKLPCLNMRDRLYQLINPVPQLLQDFDIFHEHGTRIDDGLVSQHIAYGMKLLRSALTICYDLQAWESKVLRLCYGKKPLCDLGTDPLSFMPGHGGEHNTLYDFCRLHGHGFFSTCTQYWTMCNILYGSLRKFHQQLQDFMDIWVLEEVLPTIPVWVTPELPALNIAKVAGHFFAPGMGLWAAHGAVFPISTALWHFAKTGRRDSPAFKSMTEAFTISKTGVIMRDFLNAIGVVWQLEG